MWSNSYHPSTAGYAALAQLVANGIPNPNGGAVVLVSDSWGAQSFSTVQAAIVAKYPTCTVINASVSGNRLDQMMARFTTDVIAYNPAVVVHYSCFANDLSQSLTQATILGNMDDFIIRCNTARARPVFLGVAPFSDALASSTALKPLVAAKATG